MKKLITLAAVGAAVAPATAAARTPERSTYATCYDLHSKMADGSYPRRRTAAANWLRFGTRIRLTGRSFYGMRRFVIRDTGPALADGHIDLWYNGHSCATWGVRSITFKLGWRRP